MWEKILLVLLFYSIQLSTVQSKINITFNDIEVPFKNPKYIGGIETYIKDNKVGIFLNFTTVNEFPKSVKMLYKLFKESMGLYVPTGVMIDIEFCTVFEPELRVFGDSLQIIGFSGDNCPPRPGIYGSDNLVIPPDSLPEEFTPDDHLATLQFYTEDENIFEMKLFFHVVAQQSVNKIG